MIFAMNNRIYLAAIGLGLFAGGSAHAGFVTLSIGLGYLHDAEGTGIEHRLAPDALCILVADINRDGFGPVSEAGWATGGDVLVTVLGTGSQEGANQFSPGNDLEPGFFSRNLTIDLDQFGSFSEPIPIALRWFPTLRAGDVDLDATPPNAGLPYGEFFRQTPRYAEFGVEGWFLPASGGQSITLDPYATSEFMGTDDPEAGRATQRSVPEPSCALLLMAAALGITARRRRGSRIS
jgi:hypothetical protein